MEYHWVASMAYQRVVQKAFHWVALTVYQRVAWKGTSKADSLAYLSAEQMVLKLAVKKEHC